LYYTNPNTIKSAKTPKLAKITRNYPNTLNHTKSQIQQKSENSRKTYKISQQKHTPTHKKPITSLLQTYYTAPKHHKKRIIPTPNNAKIPKKTPKNN